MSTNNGVIRRFIVERIKYGHRNTLMARKIAGIAQLALKEHLNAVEVYFGDSKKAQHSSYNQYWERFAVFPSG